MGVGINWGRSYRGCISAPPNPRPDKFNIISTEQIGVYLIALVQYEGCTTYEGRKLMVFKYHSETWLRSVRELDPHFDGSALSPIARFRPDAEGMAMARRLCEVMS